VLKVAGIDEDLEGAAAAVALDIVLCDVDGVIAGRPL